MPKSTHQFLRERERTLNDLASKINFYFQTMCYRFLILDVLLLIIRIHRISFAER